MNHTFSPNLVRPNLPLRKPSSSPSRPRHLAVPGAAPVRPASGATGNSSVLSLFIKDKSPTGSATPPAVTLNFCNYCGHAGNFRCKRCKQTLYCSVMCQTEDWKAHRHLCKAINQEPVKEKSKVNRGSSATADTVVPLKHDDVSSSQRVYLKDLNVTKIIKGTDIQASLVEFYSPGRFFLFPQSPELLEALQSISTELEKMYSLPTVAPYVPFVGEVCAVQFSCDMKWYRGLVQTLAADQKMANILYIDFGNEESVPVERIRPLAANIKLFCPCILECCLAGVEPVGGNWSGECCIAVRLMLAGKTVKFRLVETLENRIHAVDILLSMGKQLSTYLIEHSYAAKETVSTTPSAKDINAMMSAFWNNFKHLSSGTDDNIWTQPPEPLSQAVGDSFSVVITHFQSPNEISVQKVDNARVIQELQLKLREHCSQVPFPQNFRPAPNTVCCAQFSEDKQWYRAIVLAHSSEKRVCVYYLDFGNSEEVDLGHLRPINTSLLALPMQAMRCGLAGVKPNWESWSEEWLLSLQRRLLNRILRIEIQGAHEGKALVAMIDETSDPQTNVAELLITAGYSAPASVTTTNDQQDNLTTTPAEPHVPTPTCEPLVWSSTNLSCDGQTVALLASVIENPGKFYCRIDNPADHQRLIELGIELKQHCEACATPFKAKVGDPCCAIFPGDGAWYRAMVKALSEDRVSVDFVDYGYTMKVEKNHLRAITPRLLTLPFQAIRCFLAGVQPLDSEWSGETVLWFQNLVDGKQLSARVLSITTQGYGVALECRGQNVAAALISEQLAKCYGDEHGPEFQECVKENKPSQTHLQAPNQTGTISPEIPTESLPKTSSEVPMFPVDWKTVELPLNVTFQPYFAAIISPSHFYLLGPSQVEQQQKFQEVMVEVAAYCTNNQGPLSSALTRPSLGAACCAQFSADNKWYRAVVVETGESEMSVIYADFGNTEKVPVSRILPIPAHLLKLPFKIIRCTLAGKKGFPAEWPDEVQQIFQTALVNDVVVRTHSFDGSANVLSITIPTDRGGGDLADMILEELQAQNKTTPCLTTPQKADQTESCTPVLRPTTPPVCPHPKTIPKIQEELENEVDSRGLTMTPEQTAQPPHQNKKTSAAALNDPSKIEQMEPLSQNHTDINNPQTSSCCCESLKTQMDHLEQLLQLQLSLIKQLVGQTK